MGSITSLLNVAAEGLQAQSAGVDTTGQNIANANTPGYVRRTVDLSTIADGSNGGVQVTGITRGADAFTFASVLTEHGLSSSAQERSGALAQVQSLMAPTSGGLSDSLNAFFSALQGLSASPSDPSTRAQVLATATQLSQTVSSDAAAITSTQRGLLTSAQGTVTTLNQTLQQIATLNQKIASAQAVGGDTADLRDQRDVAVKSVADAIGAHVIEDKTGQITLFGGGTTLVDGGNAARLSVGLAPAGTLVFTAQRSGGSTDITTGVNDGTLGGLREAHDTDLPALSAQLDQFAYDLSTSVNAVHSAGVGLDGVGGRNLFTQSATVAGAAYAMSVDPSVAGQPDRIAASSTAGTLPGGNDVAVSLANLSSTPLGAGASSPADRVGTLLGNLGTMKSSADAEVALRQDTVTQTENLNSSIAGVSLDEEMVNLTKFQKGYEAMTKVLNTADTLLSDLMQAL